MILAGDIGGTHTRVALFDARKGQLLPVVERVYPSREHQGLDEIVSLFLSNQQITVSGACFGVAGPVLQGRARISNLTWTVDAIALAKLLGVETVWLINDLAAHAAGIAGLRPEDFASLNSVAAGEGNAALIAAGTGLGEAGLFWDGTGHQPFASEGGHADWAPRNDLELRLHRYLMDRFGHVSCERVLSGPGLKNVYDFLRDSGTEPEPDWLKEELQATQDASAVISEHGLQESASICSRALDIFVSIYGAEAGNVALRFLATSGVYLSGGIAGRILPRLTVPGFMEAFADKGRMRGLMEKIPVKVVTNEKIGLIGAARYALSRESSGAAASQTSCVRP